MLFLILASPLLPLPRVPPGFPPDQRNGDKEFVIRRAATNRVLNVLRHWVSKHSQVGGTNPGAGCWEPEATDPRSQPP